MDKDKYVKRYKYRNKANIYSFVLIIIGITLLLQNGEETLQVIGIFITSVGFLISNLLDSSK